MRLVFLIGFVLSIAMFVIARTTTKSNELPGVVTLYWATDPNPARDFQLSRFSDMFPGYRVLVDPGLGGDQTKLIVRCATGTGPDLIDLYNARMMDSLNSAGVLMDVSPYATEGGFGPENTFASVAPALSIEGKQFRYPCNIATNNVLYNRTIFEKCGVPEPTQDWTFEEFIEAGRKIRAYTGPNGEKYIPCTAFDIGELMMLHGADVFSEDGLYSALDSKEAIAAIEMFARLLKDRTIPSPAEASAVSSQGGWGGNEMSWFFNERAAMHLVGRWFIVQLPSYPGFGEKLGNTRLPRLPGYASSGAIETRAAGINAKSHKAKDALKFLQYLASEEYTEIIIQDGDGIPPNPNYVRSGEDLVNKFMPDPVFQEPFIDSVKSARAFNLSPFINSDLVFRWIYEARDRVANGLQEPEAAFRGVAEEVESEIRKNLERNPALQRKFEEITGREYTPDWFRDTPKPTYVNKGKPQP